MDRPAAGQQLTRGGPALVAGRADGKDDVGPDATAPRKRGSQARAARNNWALIEAAREVFLVQGFDAPVSTIAERAGVGMSSLYRRCRTKEELLGRLCADSMEYLAQAAQDGPAIDDPRQGLAHYVQ
ncbi:TetR/AcrR family transcriptional regulator [Actinomadura darangshiensis]|uniref:TetR/AcrR family transcriptional regulator n=1 Tax=Actinomadura darangshiensis TaxID=705336 RepID=A0A4V2YTW5_9ACTN|nr:helix-turn-helix domain-containing protein [Actinomadura darangshiensis]TDD75087.1 TetR/AcrR family transcriptional regulator [Actinomadura darangshiensis]